jgi:transcriptional regulator with XRE-family HTH domain
MTIKTTLTNALERKGWELTDLSVALREKGTPCAFQTLYSYASGLRMPRANTLVAIAELLDVTTDELLGAAPAHESAEAV